MTKGATRWINIFVLYAVMNMTLKKNNDIAFEDLPADWICPVCGVGKDQFTKA